MRKFKFCTGQYYHIYNRGVDKRNIFLDTGDYIRFLKSLREFNNESSCSQRDYIKREAKKKLGARKKPSSQYWELGFFLAQLPKLVDVICYCLNQNHHHFILKQMVKDGISKLMHKLDTGYTNYFNQKYKRSGYLFEGKFKAVHLADEEKLIWTSGYVNGNSEIHKIAKADSYQWCSYPDYLAKRSGTLCNKRIILNQFKDIADYQKFVEGVIKEYQERKEIKKFLLE